MGLPNLAYFSSTPTQDVSQGSPDYGLQIAPYDLLKSDRALAEKTRKTFGMDAHDWQFDGGGSAGCDLTLLTWVTEVIG